jgi:hypothetical protein
MSKKNYPNLDISDLRPGDVGLMMGEGEISKLIGLPCYAIPIALD